MPIDEPHDVTEILNRWRSGDEEAPEHLFPLVYDELRRRARSFLARERSNHTLQPTALVHEAYLRLVDQESPAIENRVHFYGIASRLMRQVLVDHARGFKAEKRGGAVQRFSVENFDLIPDQSAGDLLALNEALESLENYDKRKCRIVDMRFFGGLKEEEIAEVLGVSERTIKRDWQFAKLWLLRELSQTSQGQGPEAGQAE